VEESARQGRQGRFYRRHVVAAPDIDVDVKAAVEVKADSGALRASLPQQGQYPVQLIGDWSWTGRAVRTCRVLSVKRDHFRHLRSPPGSMPQGEQNTAEISMNDA
jgi:hypothetical protein